MFTQKHTDGDSQTVDRLSGPLGSLATSSDPGGWDPHTVWEQRVREPRQSHRLPRIGTVYITVAPASPGWDPLETWRGRVQHARRGF